VIGFCLLACLCRILDVGGGVLVGLGGWCCVFVGCVGGGLFFFFLLLCVGVLGVGVCVCGVFVLSMGNWLGLVVFWVGMVWRLLVLCYCFGWWLFGFFCGWVLGFVCWMVLVLCWRLGRLA